LPDNDEPGEKYVGVVLDLPQNLKPMPAVRVVRLDKLSGGNPMPVGGDVVDWINGHGEEVLVKNLRKLIDATEVEEAPPV